MPNQELTNKGWDAMSTVLEREMPQKKKRRGIIWWWFGGLASAAAFIALIIMVQKQDPMAYSTVRPALELVASTDIDSGAYANAILKDTISKGKTNTSEKQHSTRSTITTTQNNPFKIAIQNTKQGSNWDENIETKTTPLSYPPSAKSKINQTDIISGKPTIPRLLNTQKLENIEREWSSQSLISTLPIHVFDIKYRPSLSTSPIIQNQKKEYNKSYLSIIADLGYFHKAEAILSYGVGITYQYELLPRLTLGLGAGISFLETNKTETDNATTIADAPDTEVFGDPDLDSGRNSFSQLNTQFFRYNASIGYRLSRTIGISAIMGKAVHDELFEDDFILINNPNPQPLMTKKRSTSYFGIGAEVKLSRRVFTSFGYNYFLRDFRAVSVTGSNIGQINLGLSYRIGLRR